MPSETSENNVVTVLRPRSRSNKRVPKLGSGICLVGAFPPPVHGMAVVNAAICEHLSRRGVVPIALDLSPASISRTWFNRLARVWKIAAALFQFLRRGLAVHASTLYVGLSAGWGQVYEALFVGIARLRGARIYLHHHSFVYVMQRRLRTRLLVRLAGPSATHIVLCEGHDRQLRRQYPAATLTRVVPNAAIIGDSFATEHRKRIRPDRIGFLGNISHEKGIPEVLAIAERLASYEPCLKVYIAGPFETRIVEKTVMRYASRLQIIEYIGPRYGSEKETFWDMIDVLLFPSKNEAAPLVVYEAMAHGVVVIAWERGCLSDMVPANAGLLVRRDQDFVAVAVEQLLAWQRNPAVFAEMSESAAKEFVRQRDKYNGDLEALLDEMCPNFPSDLMTDGLNPH